MSRIVSGQFTINLPGTSTYINLVHEQQIFNDPTTGRPFIVGAQFSVGQALVMTGNIGFSTGCHLHFEVDSGNPVPGWNGSGYDVDPTSYLFGGCGAIIAVQGATDSKLYACRTGAVGFQEWGGYIQGAPAVASASGSPIYVATGGSDGVLYVRTEGLSWQRLVPSHCFDNPGIAVSGTTLYVACRGDGAALYYGSTTIPTGSLPALPGLSLAGGSISTGGPAVAVINGVAKYFVLGSSSPSGNVYTYSSGQWAQGPGFDCKYHVAVAAHGLKAIFVCHATADNNVYFSISQDGGVNWVTAQRITVFNTVLDGVAVAMSQSGDALVAVEGSDSSVYQSFIPWSYPTPSPQTAQMIPSNVWAGTAAAQG